MSDFTEGTRPISTKETTELSGAKLTYHERDSCERDYLRQKAADCLLSINCVNKTAGLDFTDNRVVDKQLCIRFFDFRIFLRQKF